MADTITAAGRLIAVDGTRGKDTAAAAEALAAALAERGIECAVSRFDASGLFAELAVSARTDRQLSVRTLTLVYAADLAFRLRWEIAPMLKAGRMVIAAPYLDTAVALGAACGLREQWIADLMRFAPPPDIRAHAEERKRRKGWKARLDRGYGEYCAAMLEIAAPKQTNATVRREAIALLERRRGARRLSGKSLRKLASVIRNNPPAAPRRSRGQPRSART